MLYQYIVAVIVACSFSLQANKTDQNEITLADARRLVGLVDYVASDYAAAVQDGSVIDDFEYQEMQEFSRLAIKLFQPSLQSKGPQTLLLQKKLLQLEQFIVAKKDPPAVAQVARDLKDKLVRFYHLPLTPDHIPDLQRGEKKYLDHCTSCHGIDGDGNGPLAQHLHPRPRSFLAKDFISSASPFKIYNTLMVGIPGTAMISFANTLPSDELWNVSYYILASKGGELETSAAQSSNPYGLLLTGIDFVLEKLANIKHQFSTQEYDNLEGLILDAYLEGFEKIEVQLSLLDKKQTLRLEKDFMKLRSLAKAPGQQDFIALLNSIEESLRNIKLYLRNQGEKKSNSWGEFVSSLTIIVREGFEAFLVIITLLSLVMNAGLSKARIWIHAAWVFAIAAGVVTYFILEQFIQQSGLARELLEALCTGTAVIILFYTSFWILSQGERNQWGKYITTRTKAAAGSKQLWSIFLLAFIAVYREAAETVLFYRALFSATQSTYSVVLGFLSGLVVLSVICSAILKFNMKLPLKRFFQVTSCMMFGLSIVLAGKTVRELIEAGYVSHTLIGEDWSMDFLGIYPFKETILAQLLLISIGIGIGLCMIFYRKYVGFYRKTVS